jgi:glycosyltransferase involved in cell wall biosynthesis
MNRPENRPVVNRPVVLLLGPDLGAVSGVSTHLNTLLGSGLADAFELVQFRVGSEGRTENLGARLARLIASPFALASAILTRNAAIVHLNTSLNTRAFWRDLAYMAVAKLCGRRVLYQVHGGALPRRFFGRSRIFTAFLRVMLRVPDAIVVLAQSELAAYREFVPGQSISVIPNSIDCAAYANWVRVEPAPESPLHLAYLGRLDREKGLHEALEGLALALAQGSAARLVIAGSGPDEVSLRRLVQDLRLADHVAFTGPVFGESKLALIRDADVFLFPTYAEGLPYALLEFMMAGAAPITTRVGAIPDVVLDGVHGMFVPMRDPHSIAQAITRLAADRGLLARMSAACRNRISDSYSIERLAGRFRPLYRELAGADRAGALIEP